VASWRLPEAAVKGVAQVSKLAPQEGLRGRMAQLEEQEKEQHAEARSLDADVYSATSGAAATKLEVP